MCSIFYFSVSSLRLSQYLALSRFSIYPLLSDPLMNWRWKSSFSLPHIWISTLLHLREPNQARGIICLVKALWKPVSFFYLLPPNPAEILRAWLHVPMAEHQEVLQMSTKPVSNLHTQARTSSYLSCCQTRVDPEHRKGTLCYRVTLGPLEYRGGHGITGLSVTIWPFCSLG